MSNKFSFEDNSKDVKKQLNKARESAMEAALFLVEAQAKELAAVDSGELRDKIDHIKKTSGNHVI